MNGNRSISRPSNWRPGRASTELVLLAAVNVAGVVHFADELLGVEVVGLHEIFQGMAVVPQLGVEQADEEMGIHGGELGKVHGGEGGETGAGGQAGSLRKPTANERKWTRISEGILRTGPP